MPTATIKLAVDTDGAIPAAQSLQQGLTQSFAALEAALNRATAAWTTNGRVIQAGGEGMRTAAGHAGTLSDRIEQQGRALNQHERFANRTSAVLTNLGTSAATAGGGVEVLTSALAVMAGPIGLAATAGVVLFEVLKRLGDQSDKTLAAVEASSRHVGQSFQGALADVRKIQADMAGNVEASATASFEKLRLDAEKAKEDEIAASQKAAEAEVTHLQSAVARKIEIEKRMAVDRLAIDAAYNAKLLVGQQELVAQQDKIHKSELRAVADLLVAEAAATHDKDAINTAALTKTLAGIDLEAGSDLERLAKRKAAYLVYAEAKRAREFEFQTQVIAGTRAIVAAEADLAQKELAARDRVSGARSETTAAGQQSRGDPIGAIQTRSAAAQVGIDNQIKAQELATAALVKSYQEDLAEFTRVTTEKEGDAEKADALIAQKARETQVKIQAAEAESASKIIALGEATTQRLIDLDDKVRAAKVAHLEAVEAAAKTVQQAELSLQGARASAAQSEIQTTAQVTAARLALYGQEDLAQRTILHARIDADRQAIAAEKARADQVTQNLRDELERTKAIAALQTGDARTQTLAKAKALETEILTVETQRGQKVGELNADMELTEISLQKQLNLQKQTVEEIQRANDAELDKRLFAGTETTTIAGGSFDAASLAAAAVGLVRLPGVNATVALNQILAQQRQQQLAQDALKRLTDQFNLSHGGGTGGFSVTTTPTTTPAGPAVTGLGGASGTTSGVLGFAGAFQEGGVIPGPIGRPAWAVVHGGERVTPPGGGGGPITVNVYGPVDSPARVKAIADAVVEAQRRRLRR